MTSDGAAGREPRATTDAGSIVTFISPAGGVGRTGAIANVAWLLAAIGRKVLVVDWSTEAASVHGFLKPFAAGRRDLTPWVATRLDQLARQHLGPAVAQARFAHLMPQEVLRYLPAAGVRRALHLVEGVAGAVDSTPSPSSLSSPMLRRSLVLPPDDHYIGELREVVRTAGYDYVLVDAPTDAGDEAINGAARFSDVVAVCFTLRQQHIEAAAETARRLLRKRAPGEVRVVAVATQVDDRHERRVAQSRELVRSRFTGVLADPVADRAEIPYQPYDAYDERLAALIDDPREEDTLLAAYGRLASVLTGRPVRPPEVVSSGVRTRHRRELGMEPAADTGPETVYLAYAGRDRPWADWISAQLRTARVRPTRLPRDRQVSGTILTIVSPGFAQSPAAAQVEAQVKAGDAVIVGVHVDGPRGGADVSLADPQDRADEDTARAQVLSALNLAATAPPSPRDTPRYPGAEQLQEAVFLPVRNPAFTGRDDDLETLRDLLTGIDTGGGWIGDGEAVSRPTVLCGPPGVGKSEVLREYGHRFAFDYSIVWWIDAASRETVRRSLIHLGARLGMPASGDPVAAVLAELASSRHGRWLLLYDNADEPGVLTGLMPERGTGHVAVTTRLTNASRLWDTAYAAVSVEVETFTPAECALVLRDQVKELTDEDVDRISAAVGRLPLALRLAAAWLREAATVTLRGRRGMQENAVPWAVQEFLAQLSDGLDWWRPSRHRQAEHYPPAVAVCLDLAIDSLHASEAGELTVRLLEMCAFVSSGGVQLKLLYARPFLEQLAAAAREGSESATSSLERDSMLVHRLFALAARYGLAEIDWARHARFRMHRMVQMALRDRMGEAAGTRQRQMLRALAGCAPPAADARIGDHLDIYAELQRHLRPSGAADSDERVVRAWVVDQFRYQHVSGDPVTWQVARQRVAELCDRWRTRFPPDDELLLLLTQQLAALDRALGDHAAARALDEEILGLQRRVLGKDDPRTFVTARGLGADLRGLGQFGGALVHDQESWQGFLRTLGPDHPQTLLAAHSLALSFFLVGDHREALRIGRQAYAQRVRLFGEGDRVTLGSAVALGTYLREIGEVRTALRVLAEAQQRARAARLVNETLALGKALAVTERRLGREHSSSRRSKDVWTAYGESFGDSHPETLAAMLCHAADLRARADTERAVELGAACLDGYVRVMGEGHPFTHVCQVNLGVFMFDAGDPAGARSLSEQGHTALRGLLGEQHPWTMVAIVNHARVLAELGERDAARELEQAVVANASEFLGQGHPCAVLARRNLAAGAAERGRQGVDIDIPST